MRIVVGVAGGIAAYKAVGVARELVLLGHDVHVVATEAALRFVGRPTLEAISRNPVETDLFDGVAEVRHVALGQSADLIVVAPATANTLAKLAAGIADDLLGTTILASTAPLVVAPAMHTEMWQNAATVANVATLRDRGVHVVGPASGQLTGSDSGPGRMAEPSEIVDAALATLRVQDLVGRRVVVTAGGTREPLDPVRFLGNRSSGRQGVALAEAARDRGAEVVLLAAHLEVPAPSGVRTRTVETALELREAVQEEFASADALVMAAAVADFRPEQVQDSKIKKDAHPEKLQLELVRNPDILAETAASAREGQRVIGFAAETEPDADALLEIGRAKAARKGADHLVLNKVGWREGFAQEHNAVVIVSRAGDIVTEASGSKREVADAILDLLV
ncbi:bifunctional phosphopantothenoylcysteine decarboxylase/phosphopantothenate--cysteine ligase CoaBC [Homoserinibacter sp. GY 40078]|uniref:bifunctional phosphopantothenoylcysteine decarboxylase/phosphopantothenate--cysteine ligase CoaBC n=1 Tax=Homoserinibacter sp. GY 40078 TaxID=2603275 RepID=UPI0011CC5FB4|nr:bifunctional phosphopantothenoylcysteine decarboxylase/phosphopantothenate--cysteine ligase CoaBC [Homoserinibacter sp. GY 40078]TXK17831.1 bifunctional phosphopantothenoylcysteine decarboxylase/phosphopantothenate--cysteine ligase CoaBC [Homoserinibacter sp. GY 40078]